MIIKKHCIDFWWLCQSKLHKRLGTNQSLPLTNICVSRCNVTYRPLQHPAMAMSWYWKSFCNYWPFAKWIARLPITDGKYCKWIFTIISGNEYTLPLSNEEEELWSHVNLFIQKKKITVFHTTSLHSTVSTVKFWPHCKGKAHLQ